MCLFHYTTNSFSIVDISKDEIIQRIPFPEKLNKVGSIAIADSNAFAFISDTTFYVYRNKTFQRYDYRNFNDNCIPLNYINILYQPEENKIIAGVLDRSSSASSAPEYSTYFLNVYDLDKMTSSLIPFAYPSTFHGNKSGIPKVYLSEHNNQLIVSFELDDSIYKIDLTNKHIDTIGCKSYFSDVNTASFPTGGSKQEQLKAIQNNSLFIGGYGMTYYDENKQHIYRLYRPALPEKDSEEKAYTSYDRGLHIIALDMTSNTIKEIQLANGQYYVPMHWSYNRFHNSLVYPKLEEHAAKKDVCFYNVHSITMYND